MSLPSTIYFEILLNLPLNSLSNTCQSNQLFNDICLSNYYWIQRFMKDYPNIPFDRNNAKEEYIIINKKYNETLYSLISFMNNGPKDLVQNVFNEHWNIKDISQSLVNAVTDERLSKYKKSWIELISMMATKYNISACDAAFEVGKLFYK